MNTETAEVFMRCHRAGADRDEDPRIQKAVRVAQRDEALKGQLAEQIEFDERCTRAARSIEAPPDLAGKLIALPDHGGQRMHWKMFLKQPPFLGAGIALILLIGWGIAFAVNRYNDFPGREDVERIVASNDETRGRDMQAKSSEVGSLEDWLVMRGFEKFYVPPQFAQYKTLGARVFKQDGLPVAQMVIEKNKEPFYIFYMFGADDFGVKIAPPDQWRIFKEDDWVAAVQQHEDSCFMIAFRGSKQEMKEFLAAAH